MIDIVVSNKKSKIMELLQNIEMEKDKELARMVVEKEPEIK